MNNFHFSSAFLSSIELPTERSSSRLEVMILRAGLVFGVLLAALLLAPVPALAQTPLVEAQEQGDALVSAQSSADQLRSRLVARLEAVGTVLDATSGQPIADVKLLIRTGYFDPEKPSLRRTETQRRTIDGAFSFECEACTDAKIRFLAEGFHSRVIRLQSTDGKEKVASGESRVFNILLEPLRAPVTLEPYRGQLVTDVDPGKARVLALGEPSLASTNLEKARNLAQKTGSPLRYLSLRSEVDEKGEPLIGTLTWDSSCELPLGVGGIPGDPSNPPQAAKYYETVASASIDFSTAAGGVVVYQPRATRFEEIRREMGQAPAEGYQPTLDFEPGSSEPVYFYVRIGDLYGWGIAQSPILEETSNGRRLVSSVELYLNPDGTRNLETVS